MNGGSQIRAATPNRAQNTRALIICALVAALIVLAKQFFHFPLRIPGHSGIFWMALLVIGRGAAGHRYAGTLIGIVSGILAIALVPNSLGLLTWVKYLAPGMTVDILGLFTATRFDDPLVGALVGTIANLAKLAAGTILALLLGLPAGFLVVGIGVATVTHVLFGALGGFLGALVLRRLRFALASHDTGGSNGVSR